MSGAQDAVERSADETMQSAKTVLEVLRSAELKRASKERGIGKDLVQIGEEAKKSIEEARTLKTSHEKALVQLNKDLKTFLKFLGADANA